MALATSHNGGRSQTNTNLLSIGGEYPFINYMKDASGWGLADNSGFPDPTSLDANGYLSDAAVVSGHGGVKCRIYMPFPADVPGPWVITWAGIGTIALGMTQTPNSGFSSGDLTSTTSAGGRYEFTTTTNIFSIQVSAIGNPYVTNIKLFSKADESALNAGEVFGVKFKARLAEANFGVIRFMDWQLGNTSNATNYASLKSESCAFYSAPEWRSTLFGGTTSNSGTAFSLSAPSKKTDGSNWAGLAHGATVQGRIGSSYSAKTITASSGNSSLPITGHGLSLNAPVTLNWDTGASSFPAEFTRSALYYVTAVVDADHVRLSATQGGTAITPSSSSTGTVYANPQLTLNVGSTGAILVRDSYSNYLDFFGNSYVVAGKLFTAVYDATLNSWIKWGGDASLGDAGLYNGVPLTLCARLAAELGAHAWFVAPHLSMDPISDLMPTIAAYCRDNMPFWMVPRYEGPNELWNNAGGFFQTIYAYNKSAAYGWGTNNANDWYGKVISTLGQGISAVYSADRTRYEAVAGVQTGFYGSTSAADARLKSTQYVSSGGSAAYNWVTAICMATYFSASFSGSTESDLSTAYASASGSAKIAIANAYSDAVNIGSNLFQVGAFSTIAGNWKTWALGMPVPIRKMFGYEGCYSPDYNGDSNLTLLKFGSKSNPNLYGYTIAVYAAFEAVSDATFTASFPSNFILGDFTGDGQTTSYAWSIFPGDIWSTGTPQWDAIKVYNSPKRAVNLRRRLHS